MEEELTKDERFLPILVRCTANGYLLTDLEKWRNLKPKSTGEEEREGIQVASTTWRCWGPRGASTAKGRLRWTLKTWRLAQSLHGVWLDGSPDFLLTPYTPWTQTAGRRSAVSCSETGQPRRKMPHIDIWGSPSEIFCALHYCPKVTLRPTNQVCATRPQHWKVSIVWAPLGHIQ